MYSLEEGEGDIGHAKLSEETQAAADMLAGIQSALELVSSHASKQHGAQFDRCRSSP